MSEKGNPVQSFTLEVRGSCSGTFSINNEDLKRKRSLVGKHPTRKEKEEGKPWVSC